MNDSWRQIETAWPMSPWIVAVVLLVAAGLIGLAYWQERRSVHRFWRAALAGTRTALLALVAVMLFGWTIDRYQTEPPDVVIVVDDSASMAVVDVYDDSETRLKLAKELLLDEKSAWLDELSRRYNLRVYSAAELPRPLGESNEGIAPAIEQLATNQTSSRLGNCLRAILDRQRSRSTAAIIMLTDGAVTDGISLMDAAQDAHRRSVPLFFVGLGRERPRVDLQLTDLNAEDTVFLGEVLSFEAQLVSEGYSGSAVVKLIRRGQTVPLAEQSIVLTPESPKQPIRLVHRTDVAGECEYVIEVTPVEGESTVENNRLSHQVVVRDEVIRVLLAQAYPSYEFRFLKHMLQRELNAHQSGEAQLSGFRTVLQEADLQYHETDQTAERAFPASREELFQYDVLIFGDVNPALLSRSIMNNIYEFVTMRGGGVIFIAGPRHTPLAYRNTPLEPLFPVDLDTITVPDLQTVQSEPFRPRLTPLGAFSPTTLLADSAPENERLWRDSLAPLLWTVAANEPRPGVRVLAEHPTRRTQRGTAMPVICLQFTGAGKVIFHATDETHRWRFRVGDVYFARYWLQTIRYLCRAKLLSGNRAVEISTDRREYRVGDVVHSRVRFLDERMAPAADEEVSVLFQSETGERRMVGFHRNSTDRGVFDGSAGLLPPGKYQATLLAPAMDSSSPMHRFAVTAPPGELAHVAMNATQMREAAKLSGGKFYTIETAERLLEELPTGRHVRTGSLPPLALWNTPLVAALFIVLIAAEWFGRRRLGLL